MIDAQRAGLERYLSLSYEQLTADPQAEMRKILDFLELPDESELVNEVVRVHGQRRPISNLNQLSLDNLDRDDLDEIDRVAGDWLSRCGYRA
jgi:hypothetical protein